MNIVQRIFPGVIGNVLEWYEFSLYSYFSSFIAQQFFPNSDPTAALISTFSMLAVGYLMRPLGAVIFGYLGDRLGRKKIMPLSVAVMACSTTAMALLPGYATIGIAAPIILLLLRLLQGLALGGEYSSSTVYMIEHASDKYKGFWGSLGLCGAYIGLWFGALMASMVTYFSQHTMYHDIAWRLPFLFGFVLGIVGYYIRKRMPETQAFLQLKQQNTILANPVKVLFYQEPHLLLLGISLTLMPAVTCWFVMSFAPTYMSQYGHLSLTQALSITTIATLAAAIAIPLIGLISDHVGRRNILLIPPALLIVLAYPLGRLLLDSNIVTVACALTALGLISCCLEGLIAVTLSELFAVNRRCTGIAVSLNIANGFFGGTAPLVCLYIIKISGQPLAPIAYLMLVAIISLIAAQRIKGHLNRKAQSKLAHDILLPF